MVTLGWMKELMVRIYASGIKTRDLEGDKAQVLANPGLCNDFDKTADLLETATADDADATAAGKTLLNYRASLSFFSYFYYNLCW